ncbi:MAG: hypothetical protein QOF47_758 [Mycobacterium sp.]|nr:hypothetical protein [Mycobacterium sp.]
MTPWQNEQTLPVAGSRPYRCFPTVRVGRLAALLCSAVLLCTVSGCGDDEAPAAGSDTTAGAELKGDFGGQDYGSLYDARVLQDRSIELGDYSSLAARITYNSVLGTNFNLLKTTATVFVPRGPVPQNGWTTVALGHPTFGTLKTCAPSLSRDLRGLGPTVVAFLKAGFAVTVPDYQGLGSGDVSHPYLDSTTVGFNLIDSVRAARKLVPDMSVRWAAVGMEQGGQGAWAANELVNTYGGGLDFLGSISVAPFTDLQGLVDAAAAGTLTDQQKWTMVAYLNSLKASFKDDVDLDQYRRGAAQKEWDDLLACDGHTMDQLYQTAGKVSADDLRPVNADAVEVLHGFLRKTSLPQGVSAKPMWVVYGEADPLIPPQWTDVALDRACAYGDVVQIERQPGWPQSIDVPRAAEWINARVSGTPPVNDCANRGGLPAQASPSDGETTTPDEAPPTSEFEPGTPG